MNQKKEDLPVLDVGMNSTKEEGKQGSLSREPRIKGKLSGSQSIVLHFSPADFQMNKNAQNGKCKLLSSGQKAKSFLAEK